MKTLLLASLILATSTYSMANDQQYLGRADDALRIGRTATQASVEGIDDDAAQIMTENTERRLPKVLSGNLPSDGFVNDEPSVHIGENGEVIALSDQGSFNQVSPELKSKEKNLVDKVNKLDKKFIKKVKEKKRVEEKVKEALKKFERKQRDLAKVAQRKGQDSNEFKNMLKDLHKLEDEKDKLMDQYQDLDDEQNKLLDERHEKFEALAKIQDEIFKKHKDATEEEKSKHCSLSTDEMSVSCSNGKTYVLSEDQDMGEIISDDSINLSRSVTDVMNSSRDENGEETIKWIDGVLDRGGFGSGQTK